MTHARVLLAERDVLVAMDLASELETAGIATVGITASMVEALKLVDDKQVDFALLNVGLREGASFPLAKRLTALGIPFAFLTSFEQEDIAPEFRNVPRISKPQYTCEIAKSVCKLLEGPAVNLGIGKSFARDLTG